MAVTYDQLMSLAVKDEPVRFTDRDTLLYALSVGMGRDPLDANELPYVYEGSGLKTVPSMATVLQRIPILVSGLDMVKLLHGEQWLTLHHPLPAVGEFLCDSRVSGVYDKGPGCRRHAAPAARAGRGDGAQRDRQRRPGEERNAGQRAWPEAV